MLSLDHISIQFGRRTLFADVSFVIGPPTGAGFLIDRSGLVVAGEKIK